MASEKLTALRRSEPEHLGLPNDGKGIYLRIAAGKAWITKSWVFRFMIAGRAREMGLGSLYVASLARRASERANGAGSSRRASTRLRRATPGGPPYELRPPRR